MVKLDNWQTKAERAADRRRETKANKARRDKTRRNKDLARGALALLDEHGDRLRVLAVEEERRRHRSAAAEEGAPLSSSSSSSLEIYVWVDAAPSGGIEGEGEGFEERDDFDRNGKFRPRSNSELTLPSTPESGGRKKMQGRERSNSSASLGGSNKKKGRERSNSSASLGGGGNKKKGTRGGRVRSLSSASDHSNTNRGDDAEDSFLRPPLCAEHFFGGSCDPAASPSSGRRRKASFGDSSFSCPHGKHYRRGRGPTLAEALLCTSRDSKGAGKTGGISADDAFDDPRETLEVARSSAAEAAAEELSTEDGAYSDGSCARAIPMLYHVPVPIGAERVAKPDRDDVHNDGAMHAQHPRLSEQIVAALSDAGCALSNVAYLAINGVLVFDRHQADRNDGVVLSEHDAHLLFFGDGGSKRRSQSFGHEAEAVTANNPGPSMEKKGSNHEADRPAGGDNDTDKDAAPVMALPGQVLEHVLTFLPDEASADLPRTCRTWSAEVGRSSPDLWRNLLRRRGWPLPTAQLPRAAPPPPNGGSGHERIASPEADLFRAQFAGHYAAVRDVNGIRDAVRRLASGGNGGGGGGKGGPNGGGGAKAGGATSSTARHGVALHPFREARGGGGGAPGENSSSSRRSCAGCRVWSPGRVLAAFEDDCTLRLFEACGNSNNNNKGSGGNGNGSDGAGAGPNAGACRQTVCVRASPFTSKKLPSRLVALDLDDDAVACLVEVRGAARSSRPDDRASRPYLTVIRRDDLLAAAGGGAGGARGGVRALEKGALRSFDLRGAVFDFFGNPVEHAAEAYFQPLYDYIGAFPGNYGAIDVRVRTNSIVACGGMRFVFEAEIVVPDILDEEEDDDEDSLLTEAASARRIFLFSAVTECVIWACKVEHFGSTGAYALSSLAGSNAIGAVDNREAVVAFSSTSSPGVRAIQVESNGIHLHELSEIHHNAWMSKEVSPMESILPSEVENVQGSQSWTCTHNTVAVTKSDVVVAESFVGTGTRSHSFKAVLSFHPLSPSNQSNLNQICLEQECLVHQLVPLRDDHIVALCKRYSSPWEMTAEGTWRRTTDENAELTAVLVHVPTRRELHRACLSYAASEDFADELSYPLDIAIERDTVAICASRLGLALTGSDLTAISSGRNQTECEERDCRDSSKRARKKKTKQPSRGKKDAFARGLTMRG